MFRVFDCGIKCLLRRTGTSADRSVVQRACHSGNSDLDANSLIASQMARLRRLTTFPNFVLCHDLDVTVKSPLGMLVGAASFPSAPGCGRPFALKTRWMANFRMRFSVGHADALREHDGTETDGELLIRIHEPRRTQALGHGNVLPARFRWTEASHAQSRVPGGRPQTRTILTSPDDNSRVGSSSGNVLGFSSEVCRIGLLRSAKQGRRRGRR